MPRHKNQVNFDPDTKTEYFSTTTQKPSQSQSLHWIEVKFDAHTEMKSISTTHRKNLLDPTPTQKSS